MINIGYQVAANYFTALDDPAIQAGSIEKRYKHFLVQQGLQIFTGNIQSPAFKNGFTNLESTPYQMIERHIACRQIPAMLSG
jgi:hypothetical protein